MPWAKPVEKKKPGPVGDLASSFQAGDGRGAAGAAVTAPGDARHQSLQLWRYADGDRDRPAEGRPPPAARAAADPQQVEQPVGDDVDHDRLLVAQDADDLVAWDLFELGQAKALQ